MKYNITFCHRTRKQAARLCLATFSVAPPLTHSQKDIAQRQQKRKHVIWMTTTCSLLPTRIWNWYMCYCMGIFYDRSFYLFHITPTSGPLPLQCTQPLLHTVAFKLKESKKLKQYKVIESFSVQRQPRHSNTSSNSGSRCRSIHRGSEHNIN